MAKQKKTSSGMSKYLDKISKKKNGSGVEQIEKNLKVQDFYGNIKDNYVPIKPLAEAAPQERNKKDKNGNYIWNDKEQNYEKEKFVPLMIPKLTNKKKSIKIPTDKKKL